jgi:protein ImuB
MLWIAVHLPLLSLESFAATLPPAQQAPPIVLLAEHRVAVLNAPARQAGVLPGHRRATAMALAPGLVIGEACALRDAAALQSVAHAALAFTPSVALRAHEHVVLLEVQASLRYFGGLPRLMQRLAQALAPLAHALQYATAPTPLGAALLARWRTGLEMGRHTTQPAVLASLLDEVPLALLEGAQCHAEALQAMGLQCLGELRRLPRAGAARRFGAALLQTLDRAYGQQPDPCEWIRLSPVFDSRLELFARADTTEQVLHGAAVLLQRLVAWAQAQHARVGRFELHMHHEPRHRDHLQPALSTLEVALAEPSADAAHLQLLLRERLAHATLAAPTLELSLHCAQAVPGAPPNAELFPTPGSEREGLLRLVERLQARLGREQVQQLQPRPDHRPECGAVSQAVEAAGLRLPRPSSGKASRPARPGAGGTGRTQRQKAPAGERGQGWSQTHAQTREPRPAAGVPASPAGADPAPAEPAFLRKLGLPRWAAPSLGASAEEDAAGALPLSRPAWLLPRPEPLPEREARPWLDGQPLQLLLGPERIETAWWDGEPAQRDYFVAQAADGALVWIYRDRLPSLQIQASGWYLHGRFG